MVLTTPFHERLAPLNSIQLWTHWAGYLSAVRYDQSAKHEYFAIRNSAGFFDSSPLYKYWIRGRDAERFLGGVMARDVRTCRPGRAQYTVWCDDAGFVLEDGVLFRHAENEFFLTAAEPNLGYLSDLVGRLDVTVEDVSHDYGILSVQGPRSREILAKLSPDVAGLPYFGVAQTKIGGASVQLSRTGYTGDLGYELTVPAADALAVLDAVREAGEGYGFLPFGETALLMSRIEAGLLLIGVEFSSARYAYTEHERFTPRELGLGWMLKGIEADDRPFIGRAALRRELAEKSSRWATVGIVVDWKDWDGLYRDAGLIPPKDETPLDYESMLYDDEGHRIGYATSFMYSPVLQRHIGIARVTPGFGAPGSVVHVEQTINHEYRTVAAQVARLPLYNPQRKTA